MLALLVAAAISPSIGSIDPKAPAVLDAAKLAVGTKVTLKIGTMKLERVVRTRTVTIVLNEHI
jgi:hypothetical protein